MIPEKLIRVPTKHIVMMEKCSLLLGNEKTNLGVPISNHLQIGNERDKTSHKDVPSMIDIQVQF